MGPSTVYPCALGKDVSWRKNEGDGQSVIGCFQPLFGFYRADRISRPRTKLLMKPLSRHDGWCDAPFNANYNRFVKHPYHASAEPLWRDDEIYDVIIVLDINVSKRIQGRGSALFLHIAREDYSPTQGCIALGKKHLLRLLERLTTHDKIRVG